MAKKTAKKEKKTEVLGPTYEPGRPEGKVNWRDKLTTREQKMGYIRTGERYWYAKEGFGSEKRKKPA